MFYGCLQAENLFRNRLFQSNLISEHLRQNDSFLMEFELEGFGFFFEYKINCYGNQSSSSLPFSSKIALNVSLQYFGCELQSGIRSYVDGPASKFLIGVGQLKAKVIFEDTYCIVTWVYEKEIPIDEVSILLEPKYPPSEHIVPFSENVTRVDFYAGYVIQVYVTPSMRSLSGSFQMFMAETAPKVQLPLLLKTIISNESPSLSVLEVGFFGDISDWFFNFLTWNFVRGE